MVHIGLLIVIAVVSLCIGIGIGYLIFFRMGKCAGSKAREKEILMDYVWYIPLRNVADFANELIEEKHVEGDYPLLVIRSDKYDYIDGDDVPGDLKK